MPEALPLAAIRWGSIPPLLVISLAVTTLLVCAFWGIASGIVGAVVIVLMAWRPTGLIREKISERV